MRGFPWQVGTPNRQTGLHRMKDKPHMGLLRMLNQGGPRARGTVLLCRLRIQAGSSQSDDSMKAASTPEVGPDGLDHQPVLCRTTKPWFTGERHPNNWGN